MDVLNGSCLCGGVRFTVSGEYTKIDKCHCSICRKISGSGHCACIITRPENLTWVSGRELVRTYVHSERCTPSFCERCGCPVPLIGNLGYCFVPAGALDDDPGVGTWKHLFVDSKAPWDAIGDDAPQYAERP
jgi:hypothetical protein